MTLMLLLNLAIDKDVVQVDLTEVIKEVLQSIINVLLKGAQIISQLKQ